MVIEEVLKGFDRGAARCRERILREARCSRVYTTTTHSNAIHAVPLCIEASDVVCEAVFDDCDDFDKVDEHHFTLAIPSIHGRKAKASILCRLLYPR